VPTGTVPTGTGALSNGAPVGPAARVPSSGGGEDPEGRSFSRPVRVAIAVGVVLVLALAVVLRFWTRSDLWLDEALTVDIAGQPVSHIPGLLRRDGAPPLFYVLLHFWMGMFGHSDVAVRSLSGVIGVVTMPVAWLAGRRLAGRTVAWSALLLVATSPFAAYYDTEARMYALVALLTVLGYLALARVLERPRPGNLIAVAVVASALLYSHYWALYLLAAVGLWLLWQARRGPEARRRNAWAAVGALVVGGLTFVPWVPIFVFQTRHTGTPWAAPASFAAMVHAVATFAGGSSNEGRALGLIYFALLGLGLFGLATDRRHVELDLRTRPRSRPLAWVVAATLGLAILGGITSRSAFSARYASVVFVPVVLLASLGLSTFLSRRVRTGVLAVAVVAGIVGAVPNITTNRTQAGQVARAIVAHAQAGDVVAYCPDQLGPATNRLLPSGRYRQTTFPRGIGPAFVDWVNYAAASRAASPEAFAVHLEQLAGTTGRIFVVWAPGYQTFGTKCQQIVESIQASPRYTTAALVGGASQRFYEPMWLDEFSPQRP
jgi:mannosyltransferase